jgi:hypothetical protein
MEGVALFISLLFFGFIAGCLVGLFGGGGGFYFVPVLSLVFQVQPQVAVATSLAAIIPTTISAGISHFRQGNLDLGVGIVFGAGGLIGAWIGAYASSLVSASRLQKAFGVFMLLMALQMCLSALPVTCCWASSTGPWPFFSPWEQAQGPFGGRSGWAVSGQAPWKGFTVLFLFC